MAATEETVLARQLHSNACIVSTACSLPERAPATCSMYLQHDRHPSIRQMPNISWTAALVKQKLPASANPCDAPESGL